MICNLTKKLNFGWCLFLFFSFFEGVGFGCVGFLGVFFFFFYIIVLWTSTHNSSDSQSVFRGGVSLNIHSFILCIAGF